LNEVEKFPVERKKRGGKNFGVKIGKKEKAPTVPRMTASRCVIQRHY